MAYWFQLSKPTSVKHACLTGCRGPFIWNKILRLRINLDTSEAGFMKNLKHWVKLVCYFIRLFYVFCHIILYVHNDMHQLSTMVVCMRVIWPVTCNATISESLLAVACHKMVSYMYVDYQVAYGHSQSDHSEMLRQRLQARDMVFRKSDNH